MPHSWKDYLEVGASWDAHPAIKQKLEAAIEHMWEDMSKNGGRETILEAARLAELNLGFSKVTIGYSADESYYSTENAVVCIAPDQINSVGLYIDNTLMPLTLNRLLSHELGHAADQKSYDIIQDIADFEKVFMTSDMYHSNYKPLSEATSKDDYNVYTPLSKATSDEEYETTKSFLIGVISAVAEPVKAEYKDKYESPREAKDFLKQHLASVAYEMSESDIAKMRPLATEIDKKSAQCEVTAMGNAADYLGGDRSKKGLRVDYSAHESYSPSSRLNIPNNIALTLENGLIEQDFQLIYMDEQKTYITKKQLLDALSEQRSSNGMSSEMEAVFKKGIKDGDFSVKDAEKLNKLGDYTAENGEKSSLSEALYLRAQKLNTSEMER